MDQPLCDDSRMPFVPDDFVPPLELDHPSFRLRPLGPEHNESDYAAWTSSIEHIRRTPGYAEGSWPREMTLDENRRDLERHAADFAARTGFTYTVLADRDGVETVIGCVYIYPSPSPSFDVRVRSWVRAQSADLDEELYRTVTRWLADRWPFDRIEYAPRFAS
jgi:hypothetical protein